jgi:CDP-diacylglycerol---glycerol-3-phosphate 3-phosphatidyltransferase
MTTELKYTLAAAAIIVLLSVAYGARVAIKGRARFERIDRQGGSRLLGKGAMELGYWILTPAAKFLVALGATPNQVSWISLGFGILAGVCLATGHFGYGAICATVSGFFDSLDGMVARLAGSASDAGEVLDAAVDRYAEFFFLSGLIVYYRESPMLQALALLALLGSFMISYSTAKAEALQVETPKGSMRRPERAVYLTLGASLSALSIPWFEGAAEFALGYPMICALGLVAVAANVSAIGRFRCIAETIRRREQDAAAVTTAAENRFSRDESEAASISRGAADIRS